MNALLRSRTSIFVALVAPLLAGASADGCGSDVSLGGDDPDDTTGCRLGGATYAEGDSFPDPDGCNTCTCSGGRVECTLRACDEPDVCIDERGDAHGVGESFAAPDGCNTCSCATDGTISCTAMACGDPGCNHDGTRYAYGDTFPSTDGCNTCTCTEEGITCTEIACACDPTLVCAEILGCFGGLLYPTACGPANCDAPLGPCDPTCDPTLACGAALTCFEGQLYPSTCGPANCDAPLGPCDEPPCEEVSGEDCPVECDPTLGCSEAETCFEGLLYPTGCGPANCDDPIGPCPEKACDPEALCGDLPTCFDGEVYPTTCGPTNCDEPLGPCDD